MLAAAATRGRALPTRPSLTPPLTRQLSPLAKRPPPLLLLQTTIAKAQQENGDGNDGRNRPSSSSASFPLAQLATIAAALALGATALATDPDLLDGANNYNSASRRTAAEEASLLRQWRGQRTGGAAAFSSSSSSSASSSVPSTLMIATVDGQPFALDADLVPGGAEALRRSAAAAEAEAELVAGSGQQPTAASSASALLSASPAIASAERSDDNNNPIRPKQPATTTTKRRLALLAARFSPADAAAAAMWSVAYWFVSPAQLVVILLGRIEPERSSEWLVRAVGLVPSLLICAGGGLATAVLSSAAFGSATWAVAGGLGALAASGFIEIGRPRELGEGERRRLLRRRQEFGAWASQRLTAASAARCHEREILAAFRRDAVARRAARRARRLAKREAEATAATTAGDDDEAADNNEDDDEDDDDAAWDEETIRDLVRAWAGPGAERSRSGYWRGVGLAAVEAR